MMAYQLKALRSISIIICHFSFVIVSWRNYFLWAANEKSEMIYENFLFLLTHQTAASRNFPNNRKAGELALLRMKTARHTRYLWPRSRRTQFHNQFGR